MPDDAEDQQAETIDELRDAQRVLSLAQVSLWLKLPREEVLRLAAGGELPGRLVDGEWRFGVLALNRWLGGDGAAADLADLKRTIDKMSAQVEELVARVAPLLDALPQLPQGKMISDGPAVAFDVPEAMTLEQLETEYIRHVLQRCQNNKTHTASVLGIDASTLYRKLARLGWQ